MDIVDLTAVFFAEPPVPLSNILVDLGSAGPIGAFSDVVESLLPEPYADDFRPSELDPLLSMRTLFGPTEVRIDFMQLTAPAVQAAVNLAAIETPAPEQPASACDGQNFSAESSLGDTDVEPEAESETGTEAEAAVSLRIAADTQWPLIQPPPEIPIASTIDPKIKTATNAFQPPPEMPEVAIGPAIAPAARAFAVNTSNAPDAPVAFIAKLEAHEVTPLPPAETPKNTPRGFAPLALVRRLPASVVPPLTTQSADQIDSEAAAKISPAPRREMISAEGLKTAGLASKLTAPVVLPIQPSPIKHQDFSHDPNVEIELAAAAEPSPAEKRGAEQERRIVESPGLFRRSGAAGVKATGVQIEAECAIESLKAETPFVWHRTFEASKPEKASDPALASPDIPSARETQGVQAPERVTHPENRLVSSREIKLQLRDDDGVRKVDVVVVERAGKVQVTVRSGDMELTSSLRSQLVELVRVLDREGYKTETWTPADTYPADFEVAAASAAARDEFSGSDSEKGPGQQFHEQRQQRRAPRFDWLELLEARLRKENA